ncbi:MAG: hypothetical protein R2752_05240 [Vicinamibacterales bacterium]
MKGIRAVKAAEPVKAVKDLKKFRDTPSASRALSDGHEEDEDNEGHEAGS